MPGRVTETPGDYKKTEKQEDYHDILMRTMPLMEDALILAAAALESTTAFEIFAQRICRRRRTEKTYRLL